MSGGFAPLAGRDITWRQFEQALADEGILLGTFMQELDGERWERLRIYEHPDKRRPYLMPMPPDPDATADPDLIGEACHTLGINRRRLGNRIFKA